jgi:hypothetical protein
MAGAVAEPLCRARALLGAQRGGDLGLEQLLQDRLHQRSQEVPVLDQQRLHFLNHDPAPSVLLQNFPYPTPRQVDGEFLGALSQHLCSQYRLRQPRCGDAGTDLPRRAAAGCLRRSRWQLDPRRRPPLCRDPVGRDQADAAGARDGECRTRRYGAIAVRSLSRMPPTCAG